MNYRQPACSLRVSPVCSELRHQHELQTTSLLAKSVTSTLWAKAPAWITDKFVGKNAAAFHEWTTDFKTSQHDSGNVTEERRKSMLICSQWITFFTATSFYFCPQTFSLSFISLIMLKQYEGLSMKTVYFLWQEIASNVIMEFSEN